MPITQEKVVRQQEILEQWRKSILDVSHRCIVSLRGKDGLDLLQRLSTNEVSKLETGKSVQTILTNEKGKIIDTISVLKLHDDDLLLAGNTEGDILRTWLEKYIIMEDAAVQNKKDSFVHFLLYGSDASLQNLNHSMGYYQFVEYWNTIPLHHIICPASEKETTVSRLSENGYSLKNDADYTAFRIKHGIPAYPNELSIQYNPMEAGLNDQISFTKGCYIGQEVIARLDTYNKVQRKLVKLESGARLENVPTPIFNEQEEVGLVTSIVLNQQRTRSLALGYIKTTVAHENKTFYCFSNNEKIPLTAIT